MRKGSWEVEANGRGRSPALAGRASVVEWSGPPGRDPGPEPAYVRRSVCVAAIAKIGGAATGVINGATRAAERECRPHNGFLRSTAVRRRLTFRTLSDAEVPDPRPETSIHAMLRRKIVGRCST